MVKVGKYTVRPMDAIFVPNIRRYKSLLHVCSNSMGQNPAVGVGIQSNWITKGSPLKSLPPFKFGGSLG